MEALGLKGAFYFDEDGHVACKAYHSGASYDLVGPVAAAAEGFSEISAKFC